VTTPTRSGGAVAYGVAEVDRNDLAPLGILRRRCEVRFAVIDAEVGPVALDVRLLALLFAHGVEDADIAAAIDESASAARVLDRIASVVAAGGSLAYVMRQPDRAILALGDCCPGLDDRRHLVVIVLGEAGAVHEGIDDDVVDRVLVDGLLDLGEDLLVELDASFALVRDDKISIAAAVHEQTVAEINAGDVVVFKDRRKATVDLVAWVFEVDVPDAIGALRFNAEQISAGDHCRDFDLHLAGLADAAHGDDAADIAANDVIAIEKIARRDRAWITPDVWGGGDLKVNHALEDVEHLFPGRRHGFCAFSR